MALSAAERQRNRRRRLREAALRTWSWWVVTDPRLTGRDATVAAQLVTSWMAKGWLDVPPQKVPHWRLGGAA